MKREDYNSDNIKLDISPFFWVILVFMFVIGYFDKFVLAYLCMFFHEVGHIIAAVLFRKKVIRIRILLIGINATIDMDECNLKERLVIFLSGPLTNLLFIIIALVFNKFYHFTSDKYSFFILINMYLMIFNLLPIIPLDGGEILKDFLYNNLGLFLGNLYLRNISYCLSGVMIILGFVQLTNNIFNFSLIIIGIYTFINLKLDYLEAAFMNIKHLMYRRARLIKRGTYAARDLVAIKSVRLGEILKSLDYDRFHFIYILDNDLSLLKIITEQELVDGMLKYNTELTLEDLIEKSI